MEKSWNFGNKKCANSVYSLASHITCICYCVLADLNLWFSFYSLQHKSPDYSAVYIVFQTDGETGVEGHGLTFTLGRGNELGVLEQFTVKCRK